MDHVITVAYNWHHKLAIWTKLHVLILFFFDVVWNFFAQTLLHKVQQRNETGVVGKFYTVDFLAVYCTYLPKIVNVALSLPKLL